MDSIQGLSPWAALDLMNDAFKDALLGTSDDTRGSHKVTEKHGFSVTTCYNHVDVSLEERTL
jgi:hypothetical protein